MFLKTVFFGFFSQMRSIFMVFMNIFAKRETRLYPEESIKLSNRYRGRIVLTRDKDKNERCVACNLCSVVCPVGCISLQKAKKKNGRLYPIFFRINFSRCIFCGLCEEACPTLAIQLIPDVELSDFNRKDLIYEKKDLLISGTGKYPDYNFYQFSGISISKKSSQNKKNVLKNKKKYVDVKKILP